MRVPVTGACRGWWGWGHGGTHLVLADCRRLRDACGLRLSGDSLVLDSRRRVDVNSHVNSVVPILVSHLLHHLIRQCGKVESHSTLAEHIGLNPIDIGVHGLFGPRQHGSSLVSDLPEGVRAQIRVERELLFVLAIHVEIFELSIRGRFRELDVFSHGARGRLRRSAQSKLVVVVANADTRGVAHATHSEHVASRWIFLVNVHTHHAVRGAGARGGIRGDGYAATHDSFPDLLGCERNRLVSRWRGNR